MSCSTCGSKTVLIVDDSDFDLMPLEAILTDMCEVEVEQANGGQDAIDKFKADHGKSCCTDYIKLVFMDVNMPEVDGRQATQAILGAGTGKPVKVVGVTSFESDEAVQNCYQAGMSCVISKPINVERLQAAFNEHY